MNAASNTMSPQARGNDLRIIQDQAVALVQQVGQVANEAVRELALRTDNQQTGSIPRHGGPQRDPVFRQNEVKFVNSHVGNFGVTPTLGNTTGGHTESNIARRPLAARQNRHAWRSLRPIYSTAARTPAMIVSRASSSR